MEARYARELMLPTDAFYSTLAISLHGTSSDLMLPTDAFYSTASISRRRTPSKGFPPSRVGSKTGTLRRRSLFLEHDEDKRVEDVYDIASGVALGFGGYGTVRKASHKNTKSLTRAIKTVKKADPEVDDQIHREIAILRHLDHPCICRVLETFEDFEHVHIVLEHIDGRELFDEIAARGSLDEALAASIMKQLSRALQHCHDQNIIHRDVKPENIMVRRRPTDCGLSTTHEVKLIDFGLAVMCGSGPAIWESCNCLVGSVAYMAPEAKMGQHMPASDMFSAGVVLHTMIAGCLPSDDAFSKGAVSIQRLSRDITSPIVRELIWQLLQENPIDRLTGSEIVSHSWTQDAVQFAIPQERVNRMMEHFSSFHHSTKLQQAALTALAMQATNHQLSEHRELFIAIDVDGNGRISKSELTAYIAEALPLLSVEDVSSWANIVFDSIDTDGSQEIEYTEWLAASMHNASCLSEEAMCTAFRFFDADEDGKIGEGDLARVFLRTPQEFSQGDDNAIDFDRFMLLLNTSITCYSACYN